MQPNADRCELYEGQIVNRGPVISGHATPTLLELVGEPFDQAARAVQVAFTKKHRSTKSLPND